MKGVLLAGGDGTRLWPLSHQNKHMLAVDDRHMIAYPINTLAKAGIQQIYVVAGGNHLGSFIELLGEGQQLPKLYGIEEKVNLIYRVQEKTQMPNGIMKYAGIAQAIGLFDGFIDDNIAVMLGDNIFQNENVLRRPVEEFKEGAHIFLKEIPEDQLYQNGNAKYGIAELDGDRVVGIEEKPAHPKSRFAVTGAYLYDRDVFEIIKGLKFSPRGEIEVSALNDVYVKTGKMRATIVKDGWLDPGDSIDSLHEATATVKKWKKRPEEEILPPEDIPF